MKPSNKDMNLLFSNTPASNLKHKPKHIFVSAFLGLLLVTNMAANVVQAAPVVFDFQLCNGVREFSYRYGGPTIIDKFTLISNTRHQRRVKGKMEYSKKLTFKRKRYEVKNGRTNPVRNKKFKRKTVFCNKKPYPHW